VAARSAAAATAAGCGQAAVACPRLPARLHGPVQGRVSARGTYEYGRPGRSVTSGSCTVRCGSDQLRPDGNRESLAEAVPELIGGGGAPTAAHFSCADIIGGRRKEAVYRGTWALRGAVAAAAT